MKHIVFSDKIRHAAPGLKVIQICATCSNNPTSDLLWNEIEEECQRIESSYRIEEINKRPGIAATRLAYKALGKDPNRYRPSSEAMCRRIVNGKGLYRLTTLIDVINLVSIASGYSIGGFDADKIKGDVLTLDAGTHEDIFNGIGRGTLNIAGLPVYRDIVGGIGTPTSDEERTKLTADTTHLLMLVNIYGEEMGVEETIGMIKSCLELHADASSISVSIHVAETGETMGL